MWVVEGLAIQNSSIQQDHFLESSQVEQQTKPQEFVPVFVGPNFLTEPNASVAVGIPEMSSTRSWGAAKQCHSAERNAHNVQHLQGIQLLSLNAERIVWPGDCTHEKVRSHQLSRLELFEQDHFKLPRNGTCYASPPAASST